MAKQGENKETKEAVNPAVLKFTKKQFVESKRFANRKDLVNALLDDKKTYSIEEVEKTINDFLYGKKK